MPQPTNSVIWIENNVIGFFATKYGQPANVFNWDSNVRAAFALLPLTRWKSIGREMNRKDWLISIHVIIDAESKDWGKCNSVGEITTYIHGLYQDHRTFVAALRDDKDFAGLLSGALPLPASKRKKSPRAKSNVKES